MYIFLIDKWRSRMYLFMKSEVVVCSLSVWWPIHSNPPCSQLVYLFWLWFSPESGAQLSKKKSNWGGKWSRFRFCLCLAALHMSFLSPVLTHQQIEKKKIEKPWSSDRKQHKYLFLSFWSVPLHNTTICLFSLIFFILE